MEFPEGLRFSKEHEWVLVEGNMATIGITEFAQEELGDMTSQLIESLSGARLIKTFRLEDYAAEGAQSTTIAACWASDSVSTTAGSLPRCAS